jgi:exopolyphosphatase / guanosine-5'-triphosphate,3'-diphosphate pyrophosphatase
LDLERLPADLRIERAPKDSQVKDPEQGEGAPAARVLRGAEPSEATSRVTGGGLADSLPPASRKDGAAQAPPPEKRRKRRRRKRGRKVFARDDGTPGQNAAPRPVPPHVPAPATLPPALAEEDRPPAYAALDLGTNNCRLLVAVPARRGQFRVIDAFSRIVRLGEGLSLTGRLNEDAMERAIDALAVCAAKLQTRRVRKARLIATEACRAAENGVAFIERVRERTGLELEIIDRQTEARLAVSGCGSLVDRDTRGVALFDIGGGSSEIALVDLTRERSARLANNIAAWTSLPVGVVSLAERHGGRHVTPDVFAAMVADVGEMLAAFAASNPLSEIIEGGQFHLLGTSGTVTTLAGVHLELARYDRRRVDGLWMDRANVDAMIERLLGWDYEQRVANPCIGPDRADLVLAGCAILQAIRNAWPSERLRVADRGLREGMLSELMAEDGVWRRHRRRGDKRP